MPKRPLPDAPESMPPAAASFNSAVARCWEAWETVYQRERNAGFGQPSASIVADKAYRNSMPPLCGHENIQDFIACTAHALLLGIVQTEEAAKLLYAAQVAITSNRCRPAPPKSAAA